MTTVPQSDVSGIQMGDPPRPGAVYRGQLDRSKKKSIGEIFVEELEAGPGEGAQIELRVRIHLDPDPEQPPGAWSPLVQLFAWTYDQSSYYVSYRTRPSVTIRGLFAGVRAALERCVLRGFADEYLADYLARHEVLAQEE